MYKIILKKCPVCNTDSNGAIINEVKIPLCSLCETPFKAIWIPEDKMDLYSNYKILHSGKPSCKNSAYRRRIVEKMNDPNISIEKMLIPKAKVIKKKTPPPTPKIKKILLPPAPKNNIYILKGDVLENVEMVNVIDLVGTPLTPTNKVNRILKLIKKGVANVVNLNPFTVQLSVVKGVES